MSKEFLSEIVPVLKSPAITTPTVKMNLEQKVEAWIALDVVEKAAKKRKEAIRVELLVEIEARGTQNDKGSFVLPMEIAVLTREKRQDKEPALDGLRALVAKTKKIKDEEKPFDEVKALVVNMSKLDSLIERGLLSQEDVDALRKVTWALDVDQSKDTKALIESLREEAEFEVRPVTDVTEKPVAAKAKKR
jgi:hypothetical protein